MRVFFAPILLLILISGLLSVGPARHALGATPGKKPAASERAPAKPAAGPSSRVDKLIDELDSLEKDEKRSKRRDVWLSLEEKFLLLRNKSKGEDAARAAYHAARVREGLGRRSFLASDYREAASKYEEAAKTYARSSFAPTALYQQAQVLKNLLDDPAAAVPVLEGLLKRYPDAAEAPKAEKLLAASQKEAAQQPDKPIEKKSTESSATIKNIFWKGKQQRAVITLELDGKAPYEFEFVPPDEVKKTPARIYLDIAGAFPSQDIKPGMTPKSLAVTRIRTAQSGDGTRIMFDCDGLRCFAVRTPKNAPQTIQIEVSRKVDIKDGIAVDQDDDSRTVAGKARGGGGKSPAKGDSLLEQLGLTVQTIMIDAGHGGKDPGAMAGGFSEHQFTLAMAKRVGALLQKKGFTVLYTRTSNKFISLQDRPDMANQKKADLFISIHVNANNNPDVCGLETYYLDMAKTQGAAVVAARENAVSVKNISDLQVILTDLMLSSKMEESHELARCVHGGILNEVRRAKVKAPDNGVRSAPFYVLMGARMPAILVEFGYITNKGDAANLDSESFLQNQAEGLVNGIADYKAKLARTASR